MNQLIKITTQDEVVLINLRTVSFVMQVGADVHVIFGPTRLELRGMTLANFAKQISSQ
jgi:hypothetical protein